MSKRVLSLFFALMLLVGGAAACSDDSGDDGGSGGGGSSSDSSDAPSDDGGGSGNADVQAFCDAVGDYAAAAQDDPTNPDLQQQALDLAQQFQDISGDLEGADLQELTDCNQQIADAVSG